MGQPMDYGTYAPTYATARFAVPWVLAPLAERARETRRGARILEIGCGTGNYLEALGAGLPGRRWLGLDRSREMVAQARSRGATVGVYAVADADAGLPLATGTFTLAFVVDVLHHLADYRTFFAEVARVLEPGGEFLAVTDSDENMARRSLTRFFPEVLPVERGRYPPLEDLDLHARGAGLRRAATSLAEGLIDLDDGFLAKLEAKCSSAMRLIPDEAHRRGMERVRRAREGGERWLSSYSVLRYARGG
jgi:SAM-dependent methyltransferase